MRNRKHEEMKAELAAHVAERAKTLEERGMDAAEAQKRACIEFGSAEKYAEQSREAAGLAAIEHAAQDLRFGLRLLRKSPGFTVTAVLLLALGIGANAAIFSMVDWLLLRPLPVPEAGQLTYLAANNIHDGFDNGFSYPNFNDIRAQSKAVFSELAGVQPFQLAGIRSGGETTTFWANYVSGNFFSMLGLKPALGRFFSFTPAQEASAPAEVVLSYAYWQTHFGGRAEVIGQQVAVNNQPTTIVGVAPKGFGGILAVLDTQGYLPFTPDLAGEFGASGDFFHDRKDNAGLLVVGRRRPGISVAATQPALALASARIAGAYPLGAPWRGLVARKLTSEPPGAAGANRDPLPGVAALFLGLAGMVLLLACVNIANLLLARAGLRRREMAVRAALGAGRGRLLRQMLIESLLLAGLGGAGGLAVAAGACHALNLMPTGSDVPVVLNFAVSWHVFLYACAVAAATGVAVGLVPAWQASRVAPQAALQASGRAVTAARTRLRAGLVAAEIAGSMGLLIVAGLFVRSLERAQQVDLGFDVHAVVNLTLDFHAAGYAPARGIAVASALVERARALPAVTAASMASSEPMGSFTYGGRVTLPGRPAPQQAPEVEYNSVSGEYFATMGIGLLRGRAIADSDRAASAQVAVINQKMAAAYWPKGDAVGQTFLLDGDARRAIEVVGVAANSVVDNISDPAPYFYVPLAQRYYSPAILQLHLARGADPGAVLRAARSAVRAYAPELPVYDVQTMLQATHSLNGLLLFELGAMLAAIMGLLGLFMAVIGVYGVIAYAASQRTHEIGVRVALGASRGQILKLVLRQAVVVTAAGIVLGLGLGALLATGLSSLLFGVRPLDPVTFGGATLLLGAVALAASLVPARRAMRADPIAALRCE